MRTRQFAAAGAVSALVVTVGLLGATRIGLSGQTAGSRADASIRTPWGEPDLQGIWTTEVRDSPFERPARFGGPRVPDGRGTGRARPGTGRGIIGSEPAAGAARDASRMSRGAYSAAIFPVASNLPGQPDVADHRSAGRPDSRRSRPRRKSWPLMPSAGISSELLQPTDVLPERVCPACRGRRSTGRSRHRGAPRCSRPVTITVRSFNRSGQSLRTGALGERCLMSARLPDFGGAVRR